MRHIVRTYHSASHILEHPASWLAKSTLVEEPSEQGLAPAMIKIFALMDLSQDRKELGVSETSEQQGGNSTFALHSVSMVSIFRKPITFEILTYHVHQGSFLIKFDDLLHVMSTELEEKFH